MSKIQEAAKALADVDILELTDGAIMDAAHDVGIEPVGRWHLNRIRNAHALLGVDALLGR